MEEGCPRKLVRRGCAVCLMSGMRLGVVGWVEYSEEAGRRMVCGFALQTVGRCGVSFVVRDAGVRWVRMVEAYGLHRAVGGTAGCEFRW